ncbi:class I SAM-dependent methyltransferase [Geodermatophilus sp. DSM 45219]|uniref:class I SAM-dependent methyltransferase n=1 Tax=Geodermatophilus sp. DSM 45219 TaxID=1881103 RepID=UPI00087EB9E7|nr:class I SAM-dependent methyltransferase [Geodermatophilus sp. DSM 45219]SDN51588.1 Methyltransferase domain-containing protein [Geodermatophilus sp. DSM 45219]
MDAAEVFWALHGDLPREGVGSDATTRTLLGLAAPLPPSPRALDVGCGPGRASLVLAGAGARVTAVDLHEPFLRRTRAAASAAGLPVAVVRASMTALPHPDGAFDLLWCEGAAYLMGVDRALREWRRLLRPDGVLVLTDAVWTTAGPSEEARGFWAAYPGMRDEAALVTAARAAGYDVLATHLLPDGDWTDEYHGPLAAAVDAWPDPDAATAAVLAEVRREVEVRRAHRDEFGYLALVLRRR